MWVSLICTNVRPAVLRVAACAWPSNVDDATPPAMVQTTPVPAQAMHFSRPRRATPPSRVKVSSSSELNMVASRV